MRTSNPLILNKRTIKKLNQFEMKIIRGGSVVPADTDVTDADSSCCESGKTCHADNGGNC